jgi:peptide/nickel transport system permease protein
MRYLLRRIGFYMVTAWAAITLNFFIPRFMPGNPVELLISHFKGRISPAAVKSLGALFGLSHQSIASQYVTYWSDLVHGNLGISFTYFPSSVSSVVLAALPWTLVLVGVATIISFVLGTVVGVIVGSRRGSWMDVSLPISTFFSAIPYFWFALVILYFLAIVVHWFPLSGGYSSTDLIGWNWSFLVSAAYHAVLPAVTIIVTSIAGWLLGMRNMMIVTLNEDYIVLAEAKGLSKSRINFVYAARNAILPSLAGFALSLGFVVSGAILVEIVFSYPGIGYVLFAAVNNDDYPLMQGVFLIITLAVLLANIVADVFYVMLDPRTRQGA